MAFVLKLIFLVAGLFILLTMFSALTLAAKVRRHLRNPFDRHHEDPMSDIPGDVIEGEYKVLDDGKKK